jgi:hypothetical protein
MTSPVRPKPPLTKHLRGASILFAVCAGFAAIVGTCGVSSANTADEQHTARYELSGNSPVAEYISYQTDTGQYQEANVRLPWSKQFTTFPTEVFVISAEGPGSITCTILIDGNVVSHATATGQPARTACSH